MTTTSALVASPRSVPAGHLQMETNLRRSPAALSKSLHPSKKQKLSHHSDEKQGAFARKVQLQHGNSQSSSSGQSASKWFDNVNKHVARKDKVSDIDDDEPPFFISKQDGYEPDSVEDSELGPLFGSQDRNDSENADLRGVIDDLTVENKRLKMLLKEQSVRSTSDSEAQDKLFEIRLHGLPAQKKRELEHLLKTFASNMNSNSKTGTSTSATLGSGLPSTHSPANSNVASLAPHKVVHTDSGYASNSNSGFTSTAASNGHNRLTPVSRSSRNKSIKNYLHDIPDALLPQRSPAMNPRTKMALVVRKLEQLFTGKESSGDRSQPFQQQEVSRSAAKADRREDAKNNRKYMIEGSREAHMLPVDTKVNLDTIDKTEPQVEDRPQSHNINPDGPNQANSDGIPAEDTSNSGSPEQRPTRPLDLDIHRAQIAVENIEYIRHLGMSPHIDKQYDAKEDSWIYLNLLINMAQLHTINVTPGFVRKAIRNLSTKFELSQDGHRVRWKGGKEGTIFSSEEERALDVTHDIQSESVDESGIRSSKRSGTDTSSNNNISNSMSEDKTSGQQDSSISRHQVSTSTESYLPASNPTQPSGVSSAFEYKPIVYRGKKHKSAESYLDSSSSYDSTSGDSNGLVHALSRSNLNQSRKEEGTMTFFNNPYFYSDVSADNVPVNWQTGRRDTHWVPIGIPVDVDLDESALRHHDACYYYPQFARKPYQPTGDEPTVAFSPEAITAAGEPETQPIDLPASGIAGVTPEDNFALDVQILRTGPNGRRPPMVKKVPFTGTKKPQRYGYRTRRCHRLGLQPSRLPPPSYVFFTSSSSSGHADAMETGSISESSSSSADEEYPAPPAFLHHWSTGTSSDGDMDENNGYESSVDLLRAARALDPDRVAAAEREYIINRPGGAQRVEGSLAATVGASRSASSVSSESDGSDSDDTEYDMDLDE